jgi:hypothetical protein
VTSLEHLTFSGLRRDHDRDWFRCSDLVDASQAAGCLMTRYQIRRVIKGLPKPVKRYGHAHYGTEHMDAVVAYATAKAQARRESSYGLGSR